MFVAHQTVILAIATLNYTLEAKKGTYASVIPKVSSRPQQRRRIKQAQSSKAKVRRVGKGSDGQYSLKSCDSSLIKQRKAVEFAMTRRYRDSVLI